MSLRIDTAELIAGAYVVGETGLGVLGSAIPSDGLDGASFLYNDLSLPADADKEIRGLILTPPGSGTFYAWEDGSFTLVGAADGVHTFDYRLFVDGVDMGTATITVTVGEVVGGVLGGSVLTAGVTIGGALLSGVSMMSGAFALTDVEASGSMRGVIVLGSLSGTRRKSYPVRTNKQSSRR
jgi:hypothetical protein